MGKTSLLEAVYFLCTTKSFNAKSDSECVRFGQSFFELNGLFSGPTQHQIRIYYSLDENKKYYFKDGKQIYRAADVIGNFPVVFLTPADHSITQGSPADRRRFFDSVLSQASETYLKNLLDYNKTLKHRSALLAKIKETQSTRLIKELEAWSETLVSTGARLIFHRRKFIDEFNAYIQDSYKTIMTGDEVPEIKYLFLNGYNGDKIEAAFRKIIEEKKEEEILRGINLAGPHRDDYLFSINNFNLKTYGSQGQHKTFQVALRFAEYFYLENITGKKPIFLMDDVFGELDAARAERISRYLRAVSQVFITVTDLADFSFLEKKNSDLLIKLSNNHSVYA